MVRQHPRVESCWTEADSERRARKRDLGAEDTAEDEEEGEEAQSTTAAARDRRRAAVRGGSRAERDAEIAYLNHRQICATASRVRPDDGTAGDGTAVAASQVAADL